MTTIPQTADAFKAWADRECGKWPAELQSQAFNVWKEMFKDEPGWLHAHNEFSENYRQWEAEQS